MIEILPIQNNTGEHGLGNAEAFVRWRAEVLKSEGVSESVLAAYGIDGMNMIAHHNQARLHTSTAKQDGHDFLGAFQDELMLGAAETRFWTPDDEKSYHFSVLNRYESRWITILDSDRPKPQPIGIVALLAEKTDAQTEVFESLLDHITNGRDQNDFLLPLTVHHPALPVAIEYGFERTNRFARQYGALHQLYIREGDESTPTELVA